VRIEITHLTKGVKSKKQKIADGRVNERKKIVGTGAGC
jgi:hypothetical protein